MTQIVPSLRPNEFLAWASRDFLPAPLKTTMLNGVVRYIQRTGRKPTLVKVATRELNAKTVGRMTLKNGLVVELSRLVQPFSVQVGQLEVLQSPNWDAYDAAYAVYRAAREVVLVEVQLEGSQQELDEAI